MYIKHVVVLTNVDQRAGYVMSRLCNITTNVVSVENGDAILKSLAERVRVTDSREVAYIALELLGKLAINLSLVGEVLKILVENEELENKCLGYMLEVDKKVDYGALFKERQTYLALFQDDEELLISDTDQVSVRELAGFITRLA